MVLPAAPARRGGGDGSDEYGWRQRLGGEPRRLARRPAFPPLSFRGGGLMLRLDEEKAQEHGAWSRRASPASWGEPRWLARRPAFPTWESSRKEASGSSRPGGMGWQKREGGDPGGWRRARPHLGDTGTEVGEEAAHRGGMSEAGRFLGIPPAPMRRRHRGKYVISQLP
ncbi:hypothetical protein OsJ_11723 [Oryza sativa Japonica Group]|uniref:Uncharacterized protein n=2 Tax=Oryza sativa subsp. japonica TaxID=39947 RepID=A0A8J8XIA1_ORYSJ|nr:hypothetical protein LOC_Os03g41662 [Oryza sativa Japonica Group]EAZ27779.1 hypothetical protein OsJ_11723 [Oryza sativa Japonica Group]